MKLNFDMSERFFIKGTRKDGNICFYDGCKNPYNISLNNLPKGFSYESEELAKKQIPAIKNPFIHIEWSVVTESEFILLRIEWCKNYIAHYDNN